MSYLRIESNKINSGILNTLDKDDAKRIIDKFVDENY